MKLYTLFVCLAASLGATTITDDFTDAAGNPINGYCMIAAAMPFSSSSTGYRVVGQPLRVNFDGGFTVELVPNDSSGTSYYLVNCQNISGSWSITGEVWQVPDTTSTLHINDVVISRPPAATYTIPWQQFAQNGATVGDAPIWNGYAWVPAQPALPSGVLPASNGGLGTNAAQFSGVLAMNGGVASTVTGNPTDCVLVNGMSGTCGSGGGSAAQGSPGEIQTAGSNGQLSDGGASLFSGVAQLLSLQTIGNYAGALSLDSTAPQPPSYPPNSFSWVAPPGTSNTPGIANAYQWQAPAADAAGVLSSDGQGASGGTGHVTVKPLQGAGSNVLTAGVVGACPASTIFSGQRQLFFPIVLPHLRMLPKR
ncbi:MAG TPA: hypothetical protein VKV17_16690 [Bryobacteraceae bacterium]|nr:hypothetical protein [Bryobacteraceae bacterium]